MDEREPPTDFLVDAELKALAGRSTSTRAAEDVGYALTRAWIRGLRIIIGAVMLVVAWLLAEHAIDTLSRPMASLSLVQLVGALGLGGVALWAGFAGFAVAFGEAPDRERERREQIRNAIVSRRLALRNPAKPHAQERDGPDALFKVGCWLISLVSPTLAERRPGLPRLVAFCAYCLIVGGVILALQISRD